MQAELPVKVQHVFLLDGDRRPHGIVVLFPIRNDNIQAVRRTALEEDDHFLAACLRRCLLRHDGTYQEGGYRRRADQCKCAVLYKSPS